jgi:thioredoxin reductase
MFLSENCAKHVHLLVRGETLTDTMSQYLCGRISASKNITLHPHVEIDEVVGTHHVEGVKLKYNSGRTGPASLDVGRGLRVHRRRASHRVAAAGDRPQ